MKLVREVVEVGEDSKLTRAALAWEAAVVLVPSAAEGDLEEARTPLRLALGDPERHLSLLVGEETLVGLRLLAMVLGGPENDPY